MNIDLTKLDSIGRAFDPAKFRPQLDKAKRWVNLRLGRKPKQAKQTPLPPKENVPMNEPAQPDQPQIEPTPAPQTASGPDAPPPPVSFDDIDRAAAQPPPPPPADAAPEEDEEQMTTAETLIGILQTALVLIGQDEGILSDNEKRLLRSPLNRVLKKYDIDGVLPCEIDLAVALAMIIIARLKKPKTATAWERFKAWAAGKWFRRKGEKTAAKISKATKPAEDIIDV